MQLSYVVWWLGAENTMSLTFRTLRNGKKDEVDASTERFLECEAHHMRGFCYLKHVALT